MKRKIYLLPGLMCNEKLWSRLIPLFEKSYELVHIEIPQKSSFDEIIEELLSIFPNEKINLIGFSLGGYIAGYFASKYPTRISKLLIVGNSPYNLDDEEIKKRKTAIEFARNVGFKGLSRQKIVSLLNKDNQNNETLINLIGQMYIDLGKESYIKQMSATIKRNDLFESLLNINTPITFFYSEEDRLVNKSWLEEFSKVSKSSTFIKLSGASHMLPLEEPLKLFQEIIRWLDS